MIIFVVSEITVFISVVSVEVVKWEMIVRSSKQLRFNNLSRRKFLTTLTSVSSR